MSKGLLLLLLLGVLLFFGLVIKSITLPFIYYNESFLIVLSCYFILSGTLSLSLIFKKNSSIKSLGESAQKEKLKRKLQICLGVYFFGPFLLGYSLSRLVPIIASLICYESITNEYQAIKVESYAKSFRQLSKLYAVDDKGNEISFVMKNEMLNALQLRANDKLTTKGRSCIAGYVIDNINGIARE